MEALAGAVVNSVVKIVIDQANSLIKQGGDLNQELADLKSKFTMINGAVQDAAMQQITSVAVTLWLKKLEDAAFEADNALDEISYHLLRHKAQKKDSFFSKLGGMFKDKKKAPCISSKLGGKIKEINHKVELINGEATTLGVYHKLIGGTGNNSASVSRQTDSFTVDPIFIGRDGDVSRIVEILTTPTEKEVSILPICGMGGSGKTTLARNVFNHDKTMAYFEERIWVHVSQSFDAVNLLKKIRTNSTIPFYMDSAREYSKEVLLNSLQRGLESKTYLLVLDDIWDEDRQKWEEFSRSWLGITGTKGNYILVTTRNTEVGSLVKTLDAHIMNDLSEDQCWSIIKKRAFEGGEIPPEFEIIGRSIARRCKGLPLAANVLGGMLCGRSQDEWSSIEKNWLSGVGGDENHISKVLKLSFHHLPSPLLKKCFAYCSIFPKGSSINRKKLIELWMAEGFLHTSDDDDDDMENVGNQFLKVLLHNSLLQAVDEDEYGNVKSCSMHDLVHDVAYSILGDRYIRWTRNGDESSCIPEQQAKWLRTLFYEVESSDIIFKHFQSLHAITLKVGSAKNLSDSIRELIHLRYLHIFGGNIRCLPNSIGELYHLQTLRATPEKLPSTLTCLINLRHLHVPRYTELPPHMGRLISLQTLPYYDVRDEDGYRIAELGSLKCLKGELMIYNLQNVQGEEDSRRADLSQKSGIVRLELLWKDSDGVSGEGDKNVLNGLQPHTSLMILGISGFKGRSFPLWTSKMAVCVEGRWIGLDNLTEIKLIYCSECEEIPSMGHLPRLKSLYLDGLKKVKSIGSSFYGIDHNSCKGTISVFPALERLELWDMLNLAEWEEVEIPSGAQVKVNPCLAYLKIFNAVGSGSLLTNICGNKLKTLKELTIVNIERLTCLPDRLFYDNQHLSMLEIMECPNLIELPEGMHCLNSLHELTLRECGNLRSIPYSTSGGMKSLRKLSILICPKLTNFPVTTVEAPLLEKMSIGFGDSDLWQRESFKKTVDGVLRLGSQSLGRLSLSGRDWVSLPDQLQHLTALSKLQLNGFGIEELPEWFGNLSSLSVLKLSNCHKLKHLPSVETMRRLTNLAIIVCNCPLLEERCSEQRRSDADSEWPKICHMPNIMFYGRQFRSDAQLPSIQFTLEAVAQSALLPSNRKYMF